MDASTENYKKALESFIELQNVLIESIKVDIKRNQEDIILEERKMNLNNERLLIEIKSVELALENLKNIEK